MFLEQSISNFLHYVNAVRDFNSRIVVISINLTLEKKHLSVIDIQFET